MGEKKNIFFQRHMAVHGSEEAKPLSCSVCGKRFLSNSALVCHVKIHSDDANVYDCPICSAAFDQVGRFAEAVYNANFFVGGAVDHKFSSSSAPFFRVFFSLSPPC
jgi:hypothetical protein